MYVDTSMVWEDLLIACSHNSTDERGSKSSYAPLSSLHFPTRTEHVTQGPSNLPSCPSTHHPPLRFSPRSQHRRGCTTRSITSKLHPMVHLQRKQAPSVLRPNYGCQPHCFWIHHCPLSHSVECKPVVENIRCANVVHWLLYYGRGI